MAVKGKAAKRQRRTNNSEDGTKQRDDRLSSLPDDILIRILSLLPFKLAVVTSSLSKRWHGLWTNLTSIHIYGSFNQYSSPGFFDYVDKIMNQIASPFIQSFSVAFRSKVANSRWEFSLDSWLRKVCDRNIRELKARCYDYNEFPDYIFRLPSHIFQTKSLVSLELDTEFGWQLPDPINLPNLKSLSVRIYSLEWEWVQILIKGCPSLEELSIVFMVYQKCELCLKCSNQNVRRLKIDLIEAYDLNTVINAPKLEYFAVYISEDARIRFEEYPIVLREAEIFTCMYDANAPSKDETFYRSICNVTILTLDTSVLDNIPTLFRNTTRLTLKMARSYNIEKVLTALELCPALDFLILQFWEISEEDWRTQMLPMPANVSTLPPRVLRRIDIEACWSTYDAPTKSFLKLVEHLLSHPKDLKHFHFNVVEKDFGRKSLVHKQNKELELCKLLYRCPMLSTECEVEFKGRFLKMSRKAGPRAWTTNGKIIPLN